MQAERSGRAGIPRSVLGDEDVGEDEELAHGGDDREFLRLSGGDEAVVEAADVGVVAHGVQGGHLAAAPHVGAAAGDPGFAGPLPRLAREPRDSGRRPASPWKWRYRRSGSWSGLHLVLSCEPGARVSVQAGDRTKGDQTARGPRCPRQATVRPSAVAGDAIAGNGPISPGPEKIIREGRRARICVPQIREVKVEAACRTPDVENEGKLGRGCDLTAWTGQGRSGASLIIVNSRLRKSMICSNYKRLIACARVRSGGILARLKASRPTEVGPKVGRHIPRGRWRSVRTPVTARSAARPAKAAR